MSNHHLSRSRKNETNFSTFNTLTQHEKIIEKIKPYKFFVTSQNRLFDLKKEQPTHIICNEEDDYFFTVSEPLIVKHDHQLNPIFLYNNCENDIPLLVIDKKTGEEKLIGVLAKSVFEIRRSIDI